ncbi:hypothetical protein [Pedobacter nanyangensis]|uniref:hypothetical protein n=1 Tax=Pedobacter nanyangensis TaxID=1562389 RepID=UPI000DE2ECBA|nr:hypothetical protein [Pedobacter nanyangensis]
MTSIKNIVILCLALLFVNCTLQSKSKPAIAQGIYGHVYWVQGNMMPSPDEPRASVGKPIERQINIYEVVAFKDVEGQAPLFSKINAILVKTVKSNSQGFYSCELPPGKYSIFTVEEKSSYFANSFNGEGEVNAVEIVAEKKVKLDISINYKAAY